MPTVADQEAALTLAQKAVLIQSHGVQTFDPLVVGLTAEDYLLIHACTFSATREKIRELDSEGALVLRVDFDPVLSWSLQASVTGWGGLADCHPGPLSRQALLFANGARYPHQFRREASGEEIGVLFYEDPSTTVNGGDTPEISIRLTLEFSDLDTDNFPGTETSSSWLTRVTGPAPAYADIPDQTAQAIQTTARTAVAQVVFQNATGRSGTFTATLRNNSADVSVAAYSPAWSDLTEPVDADTSEAGCPELTWPTTADPRTADTVRFYLGAWHVADIALAADLEIDSQQFPRAQAGYLELQLEWKWDGADLAEWTAPAREALTYLTGGPTDINDDVTQLLVSCYDADPATTGVLLNAFYVDRDTATWEVDAAGVRNAATLTGTDLAPGGDWDIAYVTVELPGVSVWWIKLAVTKTITAGNPVVLDPEDLDLVF